MEAVAEVRNAEHLPINFGIIFPNKIFRVFLTDIRIIGDEVTTFTITELSNASFSVDYKNTFDNEDDSLFVLAIGN